MALELVIFAGVMLAGIGGRLVWDIPRRRRRLAAWRHAAEVCGLFVDRTGPGLRLDAVLGALRVTIRAGVSDEETEVTDVAVHGLPTGLLLTLETRLTRLARSVGRTDVATGDAGFDADVFVQGAPAFVRALLDEATRRHVRRMLAAEVQVVESGSLRARLRSPWSSEVADPNMAVLPDLLAFAQVLARPIDVPEALARNARSDPAEEARLLSLLTLAREYPEHPAAAGALRQASGDPSEEIRLRAAMVAGLEGRAALLRLVEDPKADDGRAGRALEALGPDLPPLRVHELLNAALRARRVQTARACLARLGRVADDEAVRTLGRVLAVEKGDLAEAAAQGLATTGRADVEGSLLAALDHPTGFVRLAAAAALGRVGSASAVAALREAEAGPGRDADFRRAARQAVAEIQSRLAGASPGQLSLSPGEAGQITLSGGSGGEVSLAREADRQPPPEPRE